MEVLRFPNITSSLRYSIDSNCFGNRDPTASNGSAVDPTKLSNYGVEDGFVAGDLIWIPTGTTFNLGVNIDVESFMPLSNVGVANILSSQNTSYSSGNFSQETTATTTSMQRTVRAPLLIKLVNGSTISSLYTFSHLKRPFLSYLQNTKNNIKSNL